ncbi:MAG: sigma-70 family RNA polymerase sigma factor [Clostridiales bacterium]|nr:sigma-70 family RNA polymerase sigma factor [Clostridiales bacterium]
MKDKDKLDAAAERYYEEILLYCRGRVPPDDAADVAQDVFSALAEAWMKKPVEYPRQWLYKAAKDRIADYYREKKRRSRVIAGSIDEEKAAPEDGEDDEVTGGGEDSGPVYETDVSGGGIDPAVDIEGLAREIISSLPPDERRMYDMRFGRGLTYAGIADAEGITVSAVRHRLGRIKNSLIPLIKKALEDGRKDDKL